jgi:hypothetical protein
VAGGAVRRVREAGVLEDQGALRRPFRARCCRPTPTARSWSSAPT